MSVWEKKGETKKRRKGSQAKSNLADGEDEKSRYHGQKHGERPLRV